MKATSLGSKIGICKPMVLPLLYTVNGDPEAEFQALALMCHRVGAQADSYVRRERQNKFNEKKKCPKNHPNQKNNEMKIRSPPDSVCFI